MVRCKFKCTIKEICEADGNTAHIKLEPVYDGNKENKEFYKYTPNGQVEFWCVNPVANEQFEVGNEYYIDFTKCESKEGI